MSFDDYKIETLDPPLFDSLRTRIGVKMDSRVFDRTGHAGPKRSMFGQIRTGQYVYFCGGRQELSLSTCYLIPQRDTYLL